jgi:hypothetical protein
MPQCGRGLINGELIMAGKSGELYTKDYNMSYTRFTRKNRIQGVASYRVSFGCSKLATQWPMHILRRPDHGAVNHKLNYCDAKS